ncbi:glutathione S-transferase T3 [Quercus suber]|uniref:Glutathione s-transferase t3 n=1 Tax=Quercus suber TaxID=58331 RepID=A0AAW0KHD8_QUESU
MARQEDYEQYGNFLQADSDFVEPFLSGSQNPLVPIHSLPEVEIVTSKRGGNFSVDEDLLLIFAWLNIGMDAVHGTEQKGDKFWTKIWESFCKNNTYGTTRSSTSLSSRWGNINRETSRFAGFMAKVEARNSSGGTDEDKLKEAKELYKSTPNPQHGKKLPFVYEHCWVALKNQPKWSVPKERSKRHLPTPSSIDQVDSNDDDTVVLERPIGRKAEKAKRKRADGDNGFDNYLAKKLQYIQASHEQDQEALRIKAEKLRLKTIKEEGRIMTMDTSGMNDKESRYFENLKDQILARQVGVDPRNM